MTALLAKTPICQVITYNISQTITLKNIFWFESNSPLEIFFLFDVKKQPHNNFYSFTAAHVKIIKEIKQIMYLRVRVPLAGFHSFWLEKLHSCFPEMLTSSRHPSALFLENTICSGRAAQCYLCWHQRLCVQSNSTSIWCKLTCHLVKWLTQYLVMQYLAQCLFHMLGW